MKWRKQSRQSRKHGVKSQGDKKKKKRHLKRIVTISQDTCKEKRWSCNCRLEVNNAGSYTPSDLYATPKSLEFVLWNFEGDAWLCFHFKNGIWQQCGEEHRGVANIGISMFQNILAWCLVRKSQRKKLRNRKRNGIHSHVNHLL